MTQKKMTATLFKSKFLLLLLLGFIFRLTFTSTLLDFIKDGLNVLKEGQGQHVRTDGVTGHHLQLIKVVVANSDSEHRRPFVL